MHSSVLVFKTVNSDSEFTYDEDEIFEMIKDRGADYTTEEKIADDDDLTFLTHGKGTYKDHVLKLTPQETDEVRELEEHNIREELNAILQEGKTTSLLNPLKLYSIKQIAGMEFGTLVIIDDNEVMNIREFIASLTPNEENAFELVQQFDYHI